MTCPPSSADDDATALAIDDNITAALNPLGDRHDLAERDRATCWLLAHADAAYPVVKQRVAVHGPPALELLGFFDRPESTEIFEGALRDGKGGAAEAALALARASDPRARDILIASVGDADPLVAAASLDGLRVRADHTACTAVEGAIGSLDARVRYAAVRAGVALGCLDRTRLRGLATSDPDPDVRALAGRAGRAR